MARKMNKHNAACEAIYKANTVPEVLSMHINAMVALLEYIEELESRLNDHAYDRYDHKNLDKCPEARR
jgi:hypothetical protein